MTTKKLVELLRELTPTEFSDSILLMWISNCENTILTDVLLASPEDCVELTAPSDEKLTVPHPWDKLYLPYMQAQVAHANGEYDHYANYIALFNAYMDEYARHILETVQPAGGEAVKHGYYLSAYAIAVEHGYKGTVEQWLKSLIGPQGDGGKDAYTIAVEHGYTGTVEQWLESLIGPKGDTGKTGETTLPIARGTSADGIAYTATDDSSGTVLPTVSVADNANQIDAVGKGRQIVFVPMLANNTIAPTLQLNGGEIIPLRLRAPKNQGSNDVRPDATLPVPAGALMRGVPYTLTFCGKYWLVDSQIPQFTGSVAAMLTKYAENLIGLSDGAGVTFPVVNVDDGVYGEIAMATVERTKTETEAAEGNVKVPTTKKVLELLRKDITSDYTAWTPESGTEKTVENYAKTLPDGSYRIADDTIGRYEIEVFTVMNGQQWRILREHDDQFCYIIFYCGETLSILIDTETCDVQVGGRKMLTDWNIPLPTAADVGKVLTASAAGRAAWTSVTNAEEVAV